MAERPREVDLGTVGGELVVGDRIDGHEGDVGILDAVEAAQDVVVEGIRGVGEILAAEAVGELLDGAGLLVRTDAKSGRVITSGG